MSFEGVIKDIKDERQPMGKGETRSKMGGGKIWGLEKPSGVELVVC